MNHQIRIVILALSTLYIQGCGDSDTVNLDDYDEYIKSTNSEMITYYEDGTIRTKMPFKKGVKDGEAYSYYSNGVKRSVLIYKNNKLNGVQRTWYDNGTFKSEEAIRNGVRHGYTKSYYESGAKKEVVLYEDGDPAIINMYREDGTLADEKGFFDKKVIERIVG